MKYKVTVPNKNFSGERFGVKFKNGVGVGEFTKGQLKDMELRGFLVVEHVEEKKAPQKKQTPKKQETKNEK
jgi:hypothetical protein